MKKMLTIILCALAASAGAVTNQSPTNITTTSAWARASVSTGTPVLRLHYGMIDAGTNLAWTSTNAAITGAVGTASQQITGLTKSSRYYYRFRNNSTTNWAAGGSIRFYTAADSPTGTPSPSANAVMVHPTTAVLLAPTNFFGANTGLLDVAIGGMYDPTGSAAIVQADLDDHKTNVNVHVIAAITGLQTNLDSKATTGDMVQAQSDITDLQGLTNSTVYTNTPNYTQAVAQAAAAYPSSNPSNFYLSSNPSNFVTASVTDGLYSASNPSNFYPSSNPSNWVDASVTNDLNAVVATKASTNDLTAHTTNTANPHVVTAAQIGAVDTNDFADHEANLVVDVLHLTAVEKAIATNPPSTNGLASTNWVVAQNYATNTPLYVETYLGTVTGATIAAGSSDAVTTNVGHLSITWNTNAAGGGAGTTNASGIHVVLTPTNYTAATADTESHLLGIDVAMYSVQKGPLLLSAPPDNVRIGSNTYCYNYGVSIGDSAYAYSHAVAIGRGVTASIDNAVSIGAYSRAVGESVAIGYGITNVEGGTTRIKGNLNMAGYPVTNAPNLIYTNTAAYLNLLTNYTPLPSFNSVSTDVSVIKTNYLGLPDATAISNTAAAALPASWTNTGIMTALQITGGATNIGIMACTNSTTGQGTWKVYPKLHATKVTQQSFPSITSTKISFPTLVRADAGTWDGTNWTPGVVGFIKNISSLGFGAGSYVDATGGAFDLTKNGVVVLSGGFSQKISGYSLMQTCSFGYYNDNVTNTFAVGYYYMAGGGVTNDNVSTHNWTYWEVTP